jgi:aminoglycoside 6'-N-acetyltransferase
MAVTLRPATLADVATLERWDHDPDVIAATSDDAGAGKAFGDLDWNVALREQSPVSHYLIAELDGRPIGALQIIDPHGEPEHYWGEIAPNLRAVDIWIGDPADRGRGHGAEMMRLAHEICFADPAVTAIVIDPLASNVRALAFYARLGYEPLGRRRFGDDDCLVLRLAREAWRAAI